MKSISREVQRRSAYHSAKRRKSPDLFELDNQDVPFEQMDQDEFEEELNNPQAIRKAE
jgi:hypothetical protein